MADLYELDILKPLSNAEVCDYSLKQFAALLEKQFCCHLNSWNHIYQYYRLELNRDEMYCFFDVKPKIKQASDNICLGGLDLIEDDAAWVFLHTEDGESSLCIAQYDSDKQRINYSSAEQYLSVNRRQAFFAPLIHDTNLYLFSHRALGNNIPALRLHRLNALTLRYFSVFESKKIQQILMEKLALELSPSE